MGFNSFDAPMDFHISQGNYVNPFVVNEAALFPYIGELSFIERWNVIKRMAKIAYTVVIKPEILNRYKFLIKEFFPMVNSTPQELLDKVEFLMVNTHPALGFIRPLVPTTIQLGFIHIEKAKPLPKDLQRYLDGSKNGVIYLSLGSNVKASKLSPKYIKTFLTVFASLDYDVIWKWETNEMENKPENVMLEKWLPVSKNKFILHILNFHDTYFNFCSNETCSSIQKSSCSSRKAGISRWRKRSTAKCQCLSFHSSVINMQTQTAWKSSKLEHNWIYLK
jgi:hypothetical protein